MRGVRDGQVDSDKYEARQEEAILDLLFTSHYTLVTCYCRFSGRCPLQEELLEHPVVFLAEGFLEAEARAPDHELLGQAKRLHRRFHDLRGDFHRPLEELFPLDNLADQPDSAGLHGLDPPAREAQVPGQTFTDDPAQGRDQRRDAELDLGVPEDGFGRTDADVAELRQVESAGKRRAVDGGDRGFREIPEFPVIPRGRLEDLAETRGVVEFREIEPRTEGIARARDDHHADRLRLLPLAHALEDFEPHLDGYGVSPIGAVQGENANPS